MMQRKTVPLGPPAPPGSRAAALASVPDPRHPSGGRPAYPPLPLVALLQLTVAAILCGARRLYAVAQWGRERREDDPAWQCALGFPVGRSPCGATLQRVFKVLDVAAVERVVGDWFRQTGVAADDPVAIDGKTLRGIHGDEIPGVHLVSAYAHHAQAVLDQIRTAGKGQELAAVNVILEEMPLVGRRVTGDALLTQRQPCERIVQRKGDYLLPVEEHQPTLLADLAEAFSPVAAEMTSAGEM